MRSCARLWDMVRRDDVETLIEMAIVRSEQACEALPRIPVSPALSINRIRAALSAPRLFLRMRKMMSEFGQ